MRFLALSLTRKRKKNQKRYMTHMSEKDILMKSFIVSNKEQSSRDIPHLALGV